MSSYTLGDRELWSICSDDTGIEVAVRREPQSAIRRTINHLLKRTEAIDEGTVQIPWASIQKITAFKRDLFSVDLICFYIELKNGDDIELDEEMNGWRLLVDELAARLPGFMKDWWDKAVQPAFAENATIVFDCQQPEKALRDESQPQPNM